MKAPHHCFKTLMVTTYLFAAASLACAEPVASESFDYTDGLLRHQHGGHGFSGPWETGAVKVIGKTAILPNHLLATRRFAKPLDLTRPLYVAGTVRIIGPMGASASAWIGCGWEEEGDVAVFGITNNRPQLRGPNPKSKAVKFYQRPELVNETAVRCIAKLEKLSPTELRVTLWMNTGAIESPSTATAVVTEPIAVEAEINRLDLRFWCDDKQLSAAFNDLRIGRSWSDVLK